MCKRRRSIGGVLAVAVIGGDGGLPLPPINGAAVRVFPGSTYGGNGRQRSALATIRGGAFRLVIILTRWLGHADFDGIRRACRDSGVPYRVVTGGMGAVARLLNARVEKEACHVK